MQKLTTSGHNIAGTKHNIVETSRQSRFVLQEIEDPDGVVQHVQVNLSESPLTWLRARGMISERLYLAGERLREDWEAAGLGPQVTMHWDGGGSFQKKRGRGGNVTPTDYQLAAKDRFHNALGACGSGLSDVVWRVVCAGEGLSHAEKALGWPARAAKLVLSFALERIAAYYRIH